MMQLQKDGRSFDTLKTLSMYHHFPTRGNAEGLCLLAVLLLDKTSLLCRTWVQSALGGICRERQSNYSWGWVLARDGCWGIVLDTALSSRNYPDFVGLFLMVHAMVRNVPDGLAVYGCHLVLAPFQHNRCLWPCSWTPRSAGDMFRWIQVVSWGSWVSSKPLVGCLVTGDFCPSRVVAPRNDRLEGWCRA